MRLRDLFLETLSAFNANRGRSFLTILGIVIGISAVIAMTSLIDGIKYSLLGSLGLNQSRMVTIYAAPDRGVTEQDLEQLAMGIPDYEFVTGIDSARLRSSLTRASSGAGLSTLPSWGLRPQRDRSSRNPT